MMNGVPDANKMTSAEKFEYSYNKVLDGFIGTCDEWARLSLAFTAGEMAAEEVIASFDDHVAMKGFVLLLLDDIRKQENGLKIDDQVKKFRQQLAGMPEAEEK